MFAGAHVYFTLSKVQDAPDERLLGCVYADAAAVGAFSWTQFHTWANLDALDDSDFSQGLRDHLELDDRSHHSWDGGGGYAYGKQNDELRNAVSAFELGADLTRTLSHNFIEYAVDMRLRQHAPQIFQRLQHLPHGDITEFITLITKPQSDEEFWIELLTALNKSTFDGAVQNIDKAPIRNAINIALELVGDEFLAVITYQR